MTSTDILIEALSEDEIREIEDIVSHLPDRESAAIDALMLVQKNRGWISDESLRAIARQLEMSPVELDGVATFYNLIFRQPVGRHVIMMCDSVSCYVMGSDQLGKDLQQKLGIKFGETTGDDRFTLLPIVCLGACDKAPTLLIDEDLHENVGANDIDNILKQYA